MKTTTDLIIEMKSKTPEKVREELVATCLARKKNIDRLWNTLPVNKTRKPITHYDYERDRLDPRQYTKEEIADYIKMVDTWNKELKEPGFYKSALEDQIENYDMDWTVREVEVVTARAEAIQREIYGQLVDLNFLEQLSDYIHMDVPSLKEERELAKLKDSEPYKKYLNKIKEEEEYKKRCEELDKVYRMRKDLLLKREEFNGGIHILSNDDVTDEEILVSIGYQPDYIRDTLAIMDLHLYRGHIVDKDGKNPWPIVYDEHGWAKVQGEGK